MDARAGSDLGMAGGVTLPDREIVAERVLDAPRDLVFAVWTDPAHLDDWWGPLGFTTTTHDADIRTGGRWRFTMHGPDGTDYGNLVEYLAVEKPARIAYRHAGAEETADVRFEVEVLFADEDGRTRLTMRMRFASDAARDELIARVGALEGVKGTMARLRDHVTTLRGFTVTRVFDAPRELVWRAHTEARHLARWWGPKGFETTVARLELLPGGMFLYRMRSAAGQAMWGRFVFRDIAAPRRLAYVLSFSDEDGGITRAPFGADWPLEVLSIVTLDERDGKTALTLRSWPLDATEAERQAFTGGYKSMDGGFNATYDQLVDYLPGMGG